MGTGGRRDNVARAALATLRGIFGRPCAKYFSLDFKSETIKRNMGLCGIEADISERMGKKPKTITSIGPLAVVV